MKINAWARSGYRRMLSQQKETGVRKGKSKKKLSPTIL